MLICKIIIVGKPKNPAFKQLERDFLTRLKKFTNIETIVIKPASVNDERAEYAKIEEGKKILKYLEQNPTGINIVLDEHGTNHTSKDFANFLQKHKNLGSHMIFIIGGPFGLSKDVLRKCEHKLALSHMTLLHEMAYIILLEQIYRGFQIMQNTSYHKE